MDGLDALDDLVNETDAANPSPEERLVREQEEAAEAAKEQGARDWAMVPYMIGGLVTMIAPELRPVYSEERCLIWGRHANQVAEKYGWSAPDQLPELALATCTISFAAPTVLLLREQLREDKASGLLAKVGVWWRARKAARAAAKAKTGEGAPGDGGNQ